MYIVHCSSVIVRRSNVFDIISCLDISCRTSGQPRIVNHRYIHLMWSISFKHLSNHAWPLFSSSNLLYQVPARFKALNKKSLHTQSLSLISVYPARSPSGLTTCCATLQIHSMLSSSTQLVGKPEEGGAMYLRLMLTIFRGINTNSGVERHQRGVNPPLVPLNPRQIEHCCHHNPFNVVIHDPFNVAITIYSVLSFTIHSMLSFTNNSMSPSQTIQCCHSRSIQCCHSPSIQCCHSPLMLPSQSLQCCHSRSIHWCHSPSIWCSHHIPFNVVIHDPFNVVIHHPFNVCHSRSI